MALQIPFSPPPLPPILRCAGCQLPCDPGDALHTTDALFAVCSDCWAHDTERRSHVRTASDVVGDGLAKDAKNAILAALDRAVGVGDDPYVELQDGTRVPRNLACPLEHPSALGCGCGDAYPDCSSLTCADGEHHCQKE